MLLHIGGDVSIPLEKLICVLNVKGLSEDSRRYIERAKVERRYRACAGKPKAYVLINGYGNREIVVESHIASATLQKRWKSACLHEKIVELAVLSVTAAE